MDVTEPHDATGPCSAGLDTTQSGAAGVRVPDSVRAWMVRPGAAALLAAARKKVETGRSGDGSRLPVPVEHRSDVGRMLGVAWELSGRAATLKALRQGLERSGTTLETVLVAGGGPLRNAVVERAQAKQDDAAMRDRILQTLAGAGIADPVATRALRWLGPVNQSEEVAEQVARAWAALPARPNHSPTDPAIRPGGEADGTRPVGLAVFAGQVLDDPHALDRDRAAGRAVVRALAASYAAILAVESVHREAPPADALGEVGFDDWSNEQLDAADAAVAEVMSARSWRRTWALAGVQCDQVSSMVLVLNMPLHGPSAALTAMTAVGGEPLWVTAAMTHAGCAIAASANLVVRVCENPAVMEAAAAALGSACPPLVCLYGRPSSAAWDVLGAVVRAGGQLLISADRDVAGCQIFDEVVASFPPHQVAAWLPQAEGRYEEQRLQDFLADMTRHAETADLTGSADPEHPPAAASICRDC